MKNIELTKVISDEQQWDGELIEFDPDSSPEAWSFFKKIYTEDQLPFISEFDTEKLKLTKNNEARRLAIGLKPGSYLAEEGKFWPKFRIAGDCDFNFDEKKVEQFESILKNSENIKLLSDCAEMHHTVLNFSFMPITGRMNNLKGSLHAFGKKEIHILPGKSYDRLDTFIAALKNYYCKESKESKESKDCIKDDIVLKFAGKNEEPLVSYLDKFNNVYEYCSRIYFIKDTEFVDKLIESGNQPLSSEENIKEYMDNAMSYWRIRKKVFEERLSNRQN
ncbi:hypothetical protein [Marinilactibacillus kalidii]|uniref:hypothetical protein n=1 Tax=Marinilactibacillus kalidii TaxID=2820274 RepID=UPI001ABE2871|nr:hypothetical protein [Marinilactibacillus kalidii]